MRHYVIVMSYGITSSLPNRSPESSCLSNPPVMTGGNSSNSSSPLSSSGGVPLPGLETTPTEQCQLMLGDSASHCGLNTSSVSHSPFPKGFVYPTLHLNLKFFIFGRSTAVVCGVGRTTNQIAFTTTSLRPRGPAVSSAAVGERACATRGPAWS